MPSTDQLTAQLDRLAAFDSGPFPVLSLFLNAQADQHGKDSFDPFLRKELGERVRTYPADGPERQSLEEDAERIREYVRSIEPSANGVAIFSCSGAKLFEAVQLGVPIQQHKLYISSVPHLYPLARLVDDYPRHAVLVADTNAARIFVVAMNSIQSRQTIANTKTRRHKMGGWSQARYQRHVQNERMQHAKEAADALTRLVRDEQINSVIIAGDEVVVPLLRAEIPKDVAGKIVDTVALDTRAPEHQVLELTRELMAQKDIASDRERVEALFDAYRANGLGVVGAESTRKALEMGQVDELLITGMPDTLDAATEGASSAPSERSDEEQLADELIVKARETAAKVTIIQDGSLLAAVGGVGAFLRFKL
jgi:peptide subunit release factor 1 (eRF1)